MTDDGRVISLLTEVLDEFPTTAPDRLVAVVLDGVQTTPQTGRLWVRRGQMNQTLRRFFPMNGYARLAAVVITAVAVVAIGAGYFLQSSTPQVGQPASPSPLVSASPAIPSPTAVALPTGLIVFEHFGGQLDGSTPTSHVVLDHRVWVVKSDGTGVHELLPNRPGDQGGMAWSPDGQHVVISEHPATGQGKLIETDATGSPPRILDTGCRLPACAEDNAPAFSRDGQRLALVRVFANPKDATKAAGSELITWDVASGKTTELVPTKVSWGGDRVWDSDPRWSPDGSRIVFYRWHFDSNEKATSSDVFVVDANGANLRQLTPAGLEAGDPDWSPDGFQIVFTSDPAHVYVEGGVQGIGGNIYTIRPDGTGLQQLTHDGYSYSPSWTGGGRILFMKGPLTGGPTGSSPNSVASDFWLMDGDGRNAVQLTRFLLAPDGSCCSFYAALQPTP
jgi:WD40-like Beta Propeller Repeat